MRQGAQRLLQCEPSKLPNELSELPNERNIEMLKLQNL